jgi:hypothetical protein
MKRLTLAVAAALALSACLPTVPASIPAPVTIADRSTADEQAAIAIELGYKAFRTALELGVDAGALTGARASLAAAADQRAYSAVLAARAAYRTANAADYITAARAANDALRAAIATVKGAN